MAGFLDLPYELALSLASLLGREDISSLRLTCRLTNQHFFDCWVHASFSNIWILPTEHALDRLHDISKHDKIRCAVRHITILGAMHAPPFFYQDSWVEGHRVQCKSMPAELEHELWQCPGNDSLSVGGYRRFLHSEKFDAILGRALQAFSGTEISVLTEPSRCMENIRILGWLEMLKNTDLTAVSTRNTQPYVWDATEMSTQDVICSKVVHVCSTLSIIKLTLEGLRPCYVNSLDMSEMKIGECFARLASLSIQLDDSYHCYHHERLCRFLNALTNLQHLKIIFGVYESRSIPLLSEVVIPSLVTLTIGSSCVLPVSDLSDIASFSSHSAQTLKSISLNNVNTYMDRDEAMYPSVRMEKNTWAQFLCQLRDKFSLDHLSIFVAAERNTSCIHFIGNGREFIKTELDERIKHLGTTDESYLFWSMKIKTLEAEGLSGDSIRRDIYGLDPNELKDVDWGEGLPDCGSKGGGGEDDGNSMPASSQQ